MTIEQSHLEKALSGGRHGLKIIVAYQASIIDYADIALIPIMKPLFGMSVPYYQLHLGQTTRAPDMPQARLIPALRLIKCAFSADRGESEDFSHWSARKSTPFFSEILEHLSFVAPQDLAVLMQGVDHDKDVNPITVVEEKSMNELLKQLAPERKNLAAHIEQEQYRDALHYAKNILRISGNAVLQKNGLSQENDLARIDEKLVNKISGNKSISVFFDLVLSSLDKAQRSLKRSDVNTLIQRLESWLERVDWLLQKTSSQHATAKQPQGEVLDLSKGQMSENLIQACERLAQLAQGVRLQIRVRAGRHANFLANGLSQKGFEVMSHQPESGGETVQLLIDNSNAKERGEIKVNVVS